MILSGAKSMEIYELSDLQRIKARYERAVAMVRETCCSCNSARNLADVARGVFEYLLKDDVVVRAGGTVRAVVRDQHCPLHSPTVAKRLDHRRLAVGVGVVVRGVWGRVVRKIRFVSTDQPGKFLVEGLRVLLDASEHGMTWYFDGEDHS